ncbi:hypothetical protein Goshw_029044 [Gossypium schwendimanii]|uniref:RNase H type-1 domain-containing protein n=1 Tax=Gossypium schwendimanii TaxID=34291 RepID=A0A7J9LTF1_GOSSC|nr:hypothetical protein [Gossypium schwendimanii]
MRVMIQFDAAFDKRNSKSILGLVVRGLMGEILASKIVLHNNVLSLFAAEAYVGLQAITLGISMGILSVAIMGDSRAFIHRSENVYAHKLEQEALWWVWMGDWVRCGAFSLLFVSHYSIATVSNLTATAVFTLTAGKRTSHPNSPLEKGEDSHLIRVVSDHNRYAPEGRWLRNPD